MVDEKLLIAAILDEPHKPGPKLVYADYLEGCGRTKLARAYRWAAREDKHPFRLQSAQFVWTRHSSDYISPSVVPSCLRFGRKPWAAYHQNTPKYPSFEAAMEALADSLEELIRWADA